MEGFGEEDHLPPTGKKKKIVPGSSSSSSSSSSTCKPKKKKKAKKNDDAKTAKAEADSTVKILPCSHAFHLGCIAEYARRRRPTRRNVDVGKSECPVFVLGLPKKKSGGRGARFAGLVQTMISQEAKHESERIDHQNSRS